MGERLDDEILAVITSVIAMCARGVHRIRKIHKVKNESTKFWRRRARSVGTTRRARSSFQEGD